MVNLIIGVSRANSTNIAQTITDMAEEVKEGGRRGRRREDGEKKREGGATERQIG